MPSEARWAMKPRNSFDTMVSVLRPANARSNLERWWRYILTVCSLELRDSSQARYSSMCPFRFLGIGRSFQAAGMRALINRSQVPNVAIDVDHGCLSIRVA